MPHPSGILIAKDLRPLVHQRPFFFDPLSRRPCRSRHSTIAIVTSQAKNTPDAGGEVWVTLVGDRGVHNGVRH
jgi:hypothetical protein